MRAQPMNPRFNLKARASEWEKWASMEENLNIHDVPNGMKNNTSSNRCQKEQYTKTKTGLFRNYLPGMWKISPGVW